MLQRHRNRLVEQARVVGRIGLFLESVRTTDETSDLQLQVRQAQAEVAAAEAELSDEAVGDRMNSVLQLIGRDMTTWAQRLELEHSGWPIGLDLNARNPTVVAHREVGPVRMYQMGGGQNYMGYHVVAHLALQKLFRDPTRPAVIAEDAKGDTYARVAPTRFPATAASEAPPIHRITAYGRAALRDGVDAWFNGGPAASGAIDPKAGRSGLWPRRRTHRPSRRS